jgi:hypothetical protein
VRAETGAGVDAVFVDDAEGAEVHVIIVAVVGEREAVVGIEPPVVGVAAVFGTTKGKHGWNSLVDGAIFLAWTISR